MMKKKYSVSVNVNFSDHIEADNEDQAWKALKKTSGINSFLFAIFRCQNRFSKRFASRRLLTVKFTESLEKIKSKHKKGGYKQLAYLPNKRHPVSSFSVPNFPLYLNLQRTVGQRLVRTRKMNVRYAQHLVQKVG
tara:strand:- start:929 stop:1333 length:405 start_codon:yes stop_codon:yes gene_type:complete